MPPVVTASTTIQIEEWHQIDTLIKQGKYKNTSDFIRRAIQAQLQGEK